MLNKLIKLNKSVIVLSVICIIGLFVSVSPIYAVTGTFSQTGSLNYSRGNSSTATLLNNDKVLVVGGDNYLWVTELYDQGTGTFSVTGDLSEVRQYGHTATLLPNGKVLVAGGINVDYHTTNKAELYDPATGTFSLTGNMNYGRYGHKAILLQNGKVLIAGGGRDNFGGVKPAELYDPATGTFSLTGNMNIARVNHQATLLNNGKVLITGGQKSDAEDSDPGTTVELYDPSTGTFSYVGDLTKFVYNHTATLLNNGKVLIAGGLDNNGDVLTTELYDSVSNISTLTGSLQTLRHNHTATLLNNGKVLIVDGENSNGLLNKSEVYDSTLNTFSRTGNTNYSHSLHTATLLSNGEVLVAGGGDPGNTAELYDPNAVNNSIPVAGAITASVNPVQVNTSVSTSVSFTDQDTVDTHTAIWSWGDGNSSAGVVTESNGSGTVSNAHTYTTAGVYEITLTVTDNNGGVGEQSFQYLTVYNPTSQGLFSAGQKYTSPAGAYVANTSLTGNVKFGLSYKYQGTVPVSHKQFTLDFKAANFEFNATTISSLVISNGVGTLMGTGTVNGTGTYNFLVVGKEGTDMIRIQIKDQSNNVVYDTQSGASATASPTTSVTGNVLAH